MSQAAAAPLRTAKQLQKIKEIKKVKAAIRWHERAREKRHSIAHERWESRQAALARQKWDYQNVKGLKLQALRRARQDWLLGPLRPNRALGDGEEKYGAVGVRYINRPEIPVHTQKHRNEIREKKGEQLVYPLVATALNSNEERKYFHIAKGDRVVVIKGREKNKIGTVKEISQHNHNVMISGVNKAYTSSDIYDEVEITDPKVLTEVPIPLEDLRLVIPYRITTYTADGQPKEIYQDVIVDNITMERHTTGVDPFTGVDYGNSEFPEEHRYDPETGLPIFNRYIAGTRRRIQWPWEKEKKEAAVDTSKELEPTEEKPTWRQRLGSAGKSLREATKLLVPSTGEKTAQKEKEDESENEVELIQSEIDASQDDSIRPKGTPQTLNDYEGDSTRNLTEPSDETSSFYPTLVYPPHPNELSTELSSHIREKRWADTKDSDKIDSERSATEAKKTERQLAELEKKKEHIDAMKTPLQLRWEVDQAKKMQQKPAVSTDTLMLALGQHMQANGIKLTPKRRKAARKVEELD